MTVSIHELRRRYAVAPWVSGEAAKGRELGLKTIDYGKVEEMA